LALAVARGERIDHIRDLLLGKPPISATRQVSLQVDAEGLGGVFVHHCRRPCPAPDQPKRPVM
jgi:hypothetical protein